MKRYLQIWIGWDPRPIEVQAYTVARSSIVRRLNQPASVRALVLDDLRDRGLYRREMTRDAEGRLFDTISEATCATEFAISRFLVPTLARQYQRPVGDERWALFVDGDFLARGNVAAMLDEADSSKAVMVVKHDYRPPETTKMDGQAQQLYARKNWSSAMLFNVDHPANDALTVDVVNALPGRDLHRFCWLDDSEIGELRPEWNYLVGWTKGVADPKLVHFTTGTPALPGHEDDEFADEWRAELRRAAG